MDRLPGTLLSESLLLALAGGALGVLLARGGIALLVWLAPDGLPRLDEIAINGVVLLFTLGVSIVAGLLFGIIPVLRFGEPSVAALKEGGRSASEGPTRHRARNVLVVAEIALALVLLVVSGLMVRSFQALRAVNPGFTNPEDLQTFRIAVPEALVADTDQAIRMHQQIVEAVARVPGVHSVGLTSSLTMDGYDSNDPIFAEGITPDGGAVPPLRRFKWIGPNYIETMGNRLVAGRTLTFADAYERHAVVLVSEGLAREFFGSPSAALGRRIRNSPSNPWREIVGVVGDEHDNGVASPVTPTGVLAAHHERLLGSEGVHAAHAGVRDSIRSDAVADVHARAAGGGVVGEPQPADRQCKVDGVDSRRVDGADLVRADHAGDCGIGGAAARRRRHLRRDRLHRRAADAGDRRADGARRAGGRRAAAVPRPWRQARGRRDRPGCVGVLRVDAPHGRAAVWRGPTDPATYGVVSATLALVALFATYLPARRAARLDPVVALRTDA